MKFWLDCRLISPASMRCMRRLTSKAMTTLTLNVWLGKMTADKENSLQLGVLVTAGASGIGRVIAESFAHTGARLHICNIADAALDEIAQTHRT